MVEIPGYLVSMPRIPHRRICQYKSSLRAAVHSLFAALLNLLLDPLCRRENRLPLVFSCASNAGRQGSEGSV